MPDSSRKSTAEKKALPVWKEPTHRGKFPCRERNSPPVRRRTKEKPAAGAHITREAGRCAPICPLRRAADKVHDMRQRRPPPHGTRGSTGVVGGVEGHAPLTPCRISAVDARKAPASPNGHGPAGRHSVARRAGDHARMPGRSRKPTEEKRKREGRKKRNLPPRQASSVSRTTSRMSGNLRISSMS